MSLIIMCLPNPYDVYMAPFPPSVDCGNREGSNVAKCAGVYIGGLWELYPTPFSVFRYYDMRCNCARFRSLRPVNNCTNSNHPMARLLTVYVCTYVAFRRHARCSRKCVTFRAASCRHLRQT